MKSRILIAVLLAVTATDAAQAQQRSSTTMGGLMLSAWGGGAAFSDLQRFSAEARWQLPTGETESRAFARRLSAETSPVMGVGAAYWFSRHWAVRAQAGFSPTRLEITVQENEVPHIPGETPMDASGRFGSMHIWSLDGQVLYRLPTTPGGRVAPYALAGLGMLRYSSSGNDPLPPEAEPAFSRESTRSKAAGVVGLGVLVPLHRHNYALSFELTDHIARTPFTSGTAAELQDGAVTVLTAQRTAPNIERVRMTNHVSLLVGVSWLHR